MGGIKIANKVKKEKQEFKVSDERDYEGVFSEEPDEDEDEIEELEEEIKVESSKPTKVTPHKNTAIKEVVEESLKDIKNHDVTIENVEDQTDKIVEKIHQSAVMHSVKTNEGIQKKVLQSAEERVMNSIEISKNKQQVKVVQATYNANKDACENLGLDDEGRPMWQIKVAKAINNFWFVIWAIISFFTLTPIIFFLKRIGTQVRSTQLKWFLAFLFYGMILFLLFLIIANVWIKTGNAPDWIETFMGSGD